MMLSSLCVFALGRRAVFFVAGFAFQGCPGGPAYEFVIRARNPGNWIASEHFFLRGLPLDGSPALFGGAPRDDERGPRGCDSVGQRGGSLAARSHQRIDHRFRRLDLSALRPLGLEAAGWPSSAPTTSLGQGFIDSRRHRRLSKLWAESPRWQ